MEPQEGALSPRGRGGNASPEEAILLEMALDPVITGFPGDESDSLVGNLLNISIGDDELDDDLLDAYIEVVSRE